MAECFPSMTDPMYCTKHCSGEACATRGFYPCCGLCLQSESALAGKEKNE